MNLIEAMNAAMEDKIVQCDLDESIAYRYNDNGFECFDLKTGVAIKPHFQRLIKYEINGTWRILEEKPKPNPNPIEELKWVVEDLRGNIYSVLYNPTVGHSDVIALLSNIEKLRDHIKKMEMENPIIKHK